MFIDFFYELLQFRNQTGVDEQGSWVSTQNVIGEMKQGQMIVEWTVYRARSSAVLLDSRWRKLIGLLPRVQ